MTNTPEPEQPVEVATRREGQVIPFGVSCTETFMSYYIRVRRGSEKLTIKVRKDTLEVVYHQRESTYDEQA